MRGNLHYMGNTYSFTSLRSFYPAELGPYRVLVLGSFLDANASLNLLRR